MVKHGVSQIPRSEAIELANDALDAPDAPTVRRAAHEWCERYYDDDFVANLDLQ
jgi:hypothetical protein